MDLCINVKEKIICKSVALQEHNVLSCFLSFRAPRTVGQCMRIHAAVHERVCRAMAHIHKHLLHTLLHETLHEYSSLSSINLNPLLSSTLPTAGHPQSDYHQHLRLRPAHGSGPNNCVCRHGKYCHNVKIIFLLKSQNSARC